MGLENELLQIAGIEVTLGQIAERVERQSPEVQAIVAEHVEVLRKRLAECEAKIPEVTAAELLADGDPTAIFAKFDRDMADVIERSPGDIAALRSAISRVKKARDRSTKGREHNEQISDDPGEVGWQRPPHPKH